MSDWRSKATCAATATPIVTKNRLTSAQVDHPSRRAGAAIGIPAAGARAGSYWSRSAAGCGELSRKRKTGVPIGTAGLPDGGESGDARGGRPAWARSSWRI